MDVAELNLLPRPRRMTLDQRTWVTPGKLLDVLDTSLHAEGYRLTIGNDGRCTVAAADPAGHFYGRATLAQLGRSRSDGSVPAGTVEDWPDLPVRGVMLDVSRCRVPTMETLYAMVDLLASWKINHLQLYMEHTFAYPGHEEVWKDADPFTAEEMGSLVAHCRERHVELTPNQNTLGHMERWLLHPRYAPLGILRGVGTNDFGLPIPASTLDPANPDSLSLVRGLVGELGRAVDGARFHVGLDEPWDLPKRRAGEWTTWASALRSSPELSGREMLVWGDMLASHPELAAGLPDRVTVCEWGYDAGHPFRAHGEALARARLPHWVCPGTSSWLSMLGRVTNAVENCREAAAAGLATGATGMLVTDWGDFGHHQTLPICQPGLAAGAAFAWCAGSNRTLDAAAIGRFLSATVYEDPGAGLGAALVGLGDVHRQMPLPAPNMSSLVLHLYLPQLAVGSGFTTGLSPEILDRIDETIQRSRSAVSSARPGSREGQRAAGELELTCRFGLLAARDARERIGVGGKLEDVPPAARARLAEDLDAIIARHRETWTVRDRPGGLDESCRWLEHLRSCYETGTAPANWAGPLVERARARAPRR